MSYNVIQGWGILVSASERGEYIVNKMHFWWRFIMSSLAAALVAGCSSVIVGVLTLIGVIVTNNRANFVVQSKLETAQAVTDTKIEELVHEVRLHNDFARRIPVLEEQLRTANRRITELEKVNHGGIFQ